MIAAPRPAHQVDLADAALCRIDRLPHPVARRGRRVDNRLVLGGRRIISGGLVEPSPRTSTR
jgi:hypothetical protein